MRQKKQSEKNIKGLVLTLRPDNAQKLLLDKHLNDTRFIYNQYVEEYLKAIKVIPPEKLMIETDAPFLIPKNFDVKPKKNRNEPKYLPHILNTIALCMGIDAEELAVQVNKNTKEFFKI